LGDSSASEISVPTFRNTLSFQSSKVNDIYIFLSTEIGLTPGGSSTIHIYKQTIHTTTQITTEQHK